MFRSTQAVQVADYQGTSTPVTVFAHRDASTKRVELFIEGLHVSMPLVEFTEMAKIVGLADTDAIVPTARKA